jgi:hypothetical protein
MGLIHIRDAERHRSYHVLRGGEGVRCIAPNLSHIYEDSALTSDLGSGAGAAGCALAGR